MADRKFRLKAVVDAMPGRPALLVADSLRIARMTADNTAPGVLVRSAVRFPQGEVGQVVRNLWQAKLRQGGDIASTGAWLSRLAR